MCARTAVAPLSLSLRQSGGAEQTHAHLSNVKVDKLPRRVRTGTVQRCKRGGSSGQGKWKISMTLLSLAAGADWQASESLGGDAPER
jgi:hypothetical protein